MRNERRDYIRRELNFYLEVKGVNRKGLPFVETARLVNISGGGAQFITACFQNYFQGQILETRVVLPEMKEVKGRLDTTATVIRLTGDMHAGKAPKKQNSRVAVCFKKHFQLVRT